MSKPSHSSWFNRCLKTIGRKRASAPLCRRLQLDVESLEDRRVLATLNIVSGNLTYTAAAGEVNQLKVTNVNGVLSFTEAPGVNITLSGAGAAGWLGNGTNRVSGPSGSVTSATNFNLLDMDDKLTLVSYPITAVAVDGGAGSDTLSRAGATPAAADVWNVANVGSGTITSVVSAFANIESLVGGGKQDTFRVENAGSLAGSIDGGGGNNILDYSPSSLSVTISFGSQTATNATDTIPFARINSVKGSSVNDVLIGRNAATIWFINASNEGSYFIPGFNPSTQSFLSFAGIESLQGGGGADTFSFNGGSLSGTLNGGGGTRNAVDYSATAGPVTVNLTTVTIPGVAGGGTNIQDITGSMGNDTLTGDGAANLLNGYFGSDLLFGLGGNDTLNGGIGTDDDYLDGGAGTNVVQSLLGFNGGNFLTDDYLSDNTNADTLVDIQQAVLTGSSNSELIDASEFSGALTVDAGDANDVVFGGTGTNTLNGGNGDDLLIGGPLGDILNGGAGNDLLQGEAGNDGYVFDTDTDQGSDTIEDSAGTADRVSFFPSTRLGATLSLGISGEQTVNANLTLTQANIENAIGSAKDDILIGTGAANLLRGGLGNDVLVGNGGVDTLEGEDGLDILIGGLGADILSGGIGNDVLVGGTTLFDGNVTALNALMAEWASGNTYNLRVSRLSGDSSGGLNGGFSLHAGTDATVFDDAIADTLNGDDNFDWFLARAGDTTDKIAAETLTTI